MEGGRVSILFTLYWSTNLFENIVLKKVLTKEKYKDFLCLYVAIRMLCQDHLSNDYFDLFDRLLKYFVKQFGRIYIIKQRKMKKNSSYDTMDVLIKFVNIQLLFIHRHSNSYH